MKVCCFSGGRGAQTILLELSRLRNIELSLVVNGFDDGKSTGEIRRLVPNFLGPSDFRKVMSTLAPPTSKSQVALSELMEFRIDIEKFDINKSLFSQLILTKKIGELFGLLDIGTRQKVNESLEVLMRYLQRDKLIGSQFLRDMSMGNLIFAGIYLSSGMSFEKMLSEISKMLGLSCSIHSASSGGGDYTLVALLENGDFLLNESSIVESKHTSKIVEIGFIKTNMIEGLKKDLMRLQVQRDRVEELRKLTLTPTINNAAEKAILDSEIIIYPPGTQYSSLYPSYQICNEAIKNSRAKKRVLFCNLDYDNDIIHLKWQDLVDRFLKYHNDEENKYSLTDIFIDKNTELSGPIESSYKNIRVHYRNLRSSKNRSKHSGILVRDCVADLYYEMNDVPTIKILTATPDSLNDYNKLHDDLKELSWNEDKLVVLNHSYIIDDGCNLHDKYNEIIVEQTSKWIKQPDTDYLLIHGFDGLYDSLDVLTLINTLKNNLGTVSLGNRFTSRTILHNARVAAYGDSTLNTIASRVGGWLIKKIFEIRFNSSIEDPLSGLILLSRSEIERIDINDKGFTTIPILIANILKKGGTVVSQSINYLPLRGYRSGGKLRLGLKTLHGLIL